MEASIRTFSSQFFGVRNGIVSRHTAYAEMQVVARTEPIVRHKSAGCERRSRLISSQLSARFSVCGVVRCAYKRGVADKGQQA